jgi:hypothetical protein
VALLVKARKGQAVRLVVAVQIVDPVGQQFLVLVVVPAALRLVAVLAVVVAVVAQTVQVEAVVQTQAAQAVTVETYRLLLQVQHIMSAQAVAVQPIQRLVLLVLAVLQE